MVHAEREKRELEWKRESPRSRIESNRMEKEGRLEERADSCGRRATETGNIALEHNDSVYLLLLRRRKE